MANVDPTTVTTTLVTIGIIAGLLHIMRRNDPKSLDGLSGTIAPDKRICAAMVVAGVAILGLGLWLALFQNVILAGIPLALLGMAGVLTPLRSFTDIHDVVWSQEAIEGPSKVAGLTLGRARTRIDWSDVKRVDYAVSGNWFAEASDGRRIYWTPIHCGFGKLVAAIKIIRPDLKLPSGL